MWYQQFSALEGHLKMNQRRQFSTMMGPVLPVPGKRFENANFAGNFKQPQVSLADSFTCKNSSQSDIISSIKDKCPEAIPYTDSRPGMCLKSRRKDRSHNQREPRKSSRQNEARQCVSDNNNSDYTADMDSYLEETPKVTTSTFKLIDFVVKKPLAKIEIPIMNSKNMILTITKSPSITIREYSISDSSEDSFVVFDHEEDKATRNPSICESEDSFIVFDGTDNASEVSYNTENEDDSENEEESSFSIIESKKVRFADDSNLCQIHPMVKWSYAYQAARRGPWEEYARDRFRFRDKISAIERQIGHIFDLKHRERIFNERFAHQETIIKL